MMRRRQFLAGAIGMAAVSDWLWNERGTAAGVPRLGILLVGNRQPFSRLFAEGLEDLGYKEGQNIQIELRSGEGNLMALPALAAELVRLKVDVIVASETPAVKAAKTATSEIPIVMAPSGDPVGTGLISSLARPGGNVTGLSAATAELAGKSLELVREVLPAASRIAALADPSNAFTKPFLEHIHTAAAALAMNVQEAMMAGSDGPERAFAEIVAQGAEAVVVQPTLPRGPIIKMIQKHRLPSVSGNRAFPEGGGLMSYAGSLADRYRKAAPYVDKILKGAKPGDLPVQQPTTFELVINLRAARVLGLTIPPAMLTRADDVIE
jgi:putative ABC transport system substrate-binding protein